MELTPDFDVPPNCGKRLLPAVLDETAANEPTRIFVSVPKSSDISEGYIDIDYEKFAKAVDKLALWLREQVGTGVGAENNSVFWALGYSVSIGATGRCEGWTYCKPAIRRLSLSLSLSSSSSNTGGRDSLAPIATVSRPTNSNAEKAGRETVLVPDDAPAMLSQILQARSMRRIPTPAVGYFFQDLVQIEHVPFIRT